MILSHDQAECEPCAFAAQEGHWGNEIPAGFTHCGSCHTTWPGTQVWGHCSGCCSTFRGEQAFDSHHESRNCPSALDAFRVGGKTYTRHVHGTGFVFYAEDQSLRRSDAVEGAVVPSVGSDSRDASAGIAEASQVLASGANQKAGRCE